MKADGAGGVLLTHYHENEQTEKKQVELCVLTDGGTYDVKYYLLNEAHDNELIKEETLSGTELKINFELPLFTCYYVKFEKKD